MPSLATSLWLIFAAATQPDPLSPPPHGRAAEVPAQPAKPAVASTKAPPSVAKPNDPTLPPSPTSPKSPKAPSAPANPTATASQPGKTAKIPPRIETPPANVEEPEEEIVADPSGKLKARKKGSRKVATTVDRAEVTERKSPWSADRYAAVVPPGLTLAALRSQLAKGGAPVAETSAPAAEHSRPMQTVSDIDKAREALRQETARLEALLKAAGNCGGGGGGMTTGEPLLPTTPVSASALREAASEQIDSVSKAVKGMKPEQAAAVVARLDRGLAAEILRRMKSTDAGAILGLLKPELAAELATEIATRKPTYPKDKKGSAK